MLWDVLIYLLLVCVAGGAYFSIAALVDRVQVARRITLALGGASQHRGERGVADGVSSMTSRLASGLAQLGEFLPLGEKDRLKIATSLQRAGVRSSNAVAIMLGIKFACLAVGLAAGLLLLTPIFPGVLGLTAGLVGGVMAGVVLNVAPELLLQYFATQRLYRIEAALPDAFDLLVVCLQSGLTFERALTRTTSNMKSFQPDLAKELGFAVLDMNVHGRTRAESLDRVADRLGSQILADLSTTVAQSERHGTPMADAVRKLASSVRVETLSRIQAKLARLPTLLLLPSITCMLPGIILIVGGPAVVQVTESLGSFGGG